MLAVSCLSLLLLASPDALEQGREALEAQDATAALDYLQRAADQGPYHLEDHVLLYQQLGIAHAYLGHTEESQRAFDRLLTLDPSHVLSYTLSPKVTFLFEKVRRSADQREATLVDVSWPRELTIADPIPIVVERVADPGALMASVKIYTRSEASKEFASVEVPLPPVGQHATWEMPAVAPQGDHEQTVSLYASAYDARGNEVFRFGSAESPRAIQLRYVPEPPWYEKWWVWAIAGGVVTVGTGTIVYVARREPPDRIGGSAGVRVGE